MTRIHLDHNATTPLRAEARQRWLEVQDELRGNPSSLHTEGRRARDLVDRARESVAAALDVAEDEIVFTASGTEANNLALRGALAARGPAAGLAVSAVEHSSVLETARALASEGRALTVVPVDAEGLVDVDALLDAAARPACTLVSVVAANNEVGTLAPLEAIRDRLASLGTERPLFHTDAVQALGRVPVRVRDWGVDLATFSAHKVGGPVGVGVAWCRSGVALEPLVVGGAQERGLRGGTEDVAGIAAAALAIELAVREQERYLERVGALSAALWGELSASVRALRLAGPPFPDLSAHASWRRLPNTLCVVVPEHDGKVLVTRLDLEGLAVGAGSACASGSLEPSHVLLAMGFDADAARAGVRVSLGRETTRDECTRAAAILRNVFSRRAS